MEVMLQKTYIEIQGTTPNFCPKNLGILVEEVSMKWMDRPSVR